MPGDSRGTGAIGRGEEDDRERLVEELRGALRGSERRFDAIVGSMTDAVTIRDRAHRFLYANAAALRHLGFDSWEELRATDPSLIMSDYEVFGEDGREVSMRDIPSVRILGGERAEPLLIRTVHRTSGEERWNLLKAAPLLDEQGEVEATITIIEEVTERRRAELRATFLVEASAALASSLDYEQTLRNVARLAVPRIADWCAVDLLDADGTRRTVAVAHVDPERLALAQELRAYVPDRVDPSEGLGRVLRTGESELYPEIGEEALASLAVDARHLELLHAVGLHSGLIVPMRVGERILGAMTLVSAESPRALDRLDRELAEQVASRAAVAIENSRLYSERSAIARTLQQELLPERLPEIPGYELASMYVPALETSLVGGDFYDVWQLEDAWMLAIGDVTGKGIEAAALTALVRHTLRAASQLDASPARMLALVDATLKKRPALSVCTALCMRIDARGATLAVGGHPLPLRLAPSGGARAVGESGPLLGAFPEVRWRDYELELEPGTMIVAYTDGVTDARAGADVDERFGVRRLRDTLERARELPAQAVMEALGGRLEQFQTGSNTDDTAAIALRRTVADGVSPGSGEAGSDARRAPREAGTSASSLKN
jgi:PAS domain S-box-containing protein